MASNGPYYQSVPPDQTGADDFKLSQGLLEYGGIVSQASMYPDPNHAQMNSEYHPQQLGENDAEDHAQLQGLVEAATSAAAQERIRQSAQIPHFAAHQDDPVDSAEQEMVTLLQGDNNRSMNKRKRSEPLQPDTDPDLSINPSASDRPKRQRRSNPAAQDPQAQDSDLSLRQYSNPAESPHHLDARAAGVHSAAALFRPPSDSSKKYTRPPMSKLFASLELSPENFLYLQAAAKQFMLDPEHPERQACVGNRGKGDSDMVKLRLHHCVREFLERENWGEKYFGVNAPPPEDGGTFPDGHQRKFVWPHDKDRIIALCTPLLRRMVTNERQRQYAVESRKGGKSDKAGEAEHDQETDARLDPNSAEPSQQQYDPRLSHAPAYQVYMLNREDKQPICDRVDYPLHDSIEWNTLTQEVQRFWCEALHLEQAPDFTTTFFDNFFIKVLTSGGLTGVSTEGEWQLACQDARQAIWLDGVVKVVVECAV